MKTMLGLGSAAEATAMAARDKSSDFVFTGGFFFCSPEGVNGAGDWENETNGTDGTDG